MPVDRGGRNHGLEGEVAKKEKQQGRWSKENEVELRGAHTRGVHTWENGTRPFFSPGVAYTWNFSGIYQSAAFDARFLRVTSRGDPRGSIKETIIADREGMFEMPGSFRQACSNI